MADINKAYDITKVSNPEIVARRADLIYGKYGKIYLSNRKNKKYMIHDPYNNKIVHFGDIRYQDYTYHKSEKIRNAYQKRTDKIKGDWLNNPFSPNMLSKYLLW